MLRLGVDIGAHVEQDGDAALGVGKRSGESDAVNGFEGAEQEARDGHDCSGISCADQAVGFGFADETCGDVHGAVFFSAEGLRGMIVHGDDFTGSDNLDGQTGDVVLGELGAQGTGVTDEHDAHTVLACG